MIYDEFVTFSDYSGGQRYACCPFHAEKEPSFTVNEETGEWYCHGECSCGGGEVTFIEKYFDVDKDVAKYALEFYNKHHRMPFPNEDTIEEWHQNLLQSASDLKILYGFGITDEVIAELKIGLADTRIIFPLKSKTGYYVNARRYLPPTKRAGYSKVPKCLNMQGLGQRRYYPYEAFNDPQGRPIVLVEGEKDMASARSCGYNAVTGTGGSAIPTDELSLFADKDVVIMLDSDKVGQKNTTLYITMLRKIAKSLQIINLPYKDFVEYYEHVGKENVDIWEYAHSADTISETDENAEAQDVTLVRSEFAENLNTWIRLKNMSVVGVEPKIYSIPTKLRCRCKNSKCAKPCPLAVSSTPVEVEVDPRQMLRFIDSADSAQDSYLRQIFGCKSVQAEPKDFINIQKIIFQESASFIDGLEEASFENRYGVYMYTDYRLSATLKYDFEACRVTDPSSQQNYYVIRDAKSVQTATPEIDEQVLEKFQKAAEGCTSCMDLIQKHYDEWMPALSIEGRPDLFGAILLTYGSVTEIPWQGGILKGWLDTMVIGDTRTGKSQMAQRFVKQLQLGSYINGENARRTGVIGGVQRFGDSWVVTWGAIPMNDRGLLVIDEASGLDVDDIKDLSATRSSGAVTLNKIVKGEARARTRLLWLSNPRSGRNLSDFYWKGYGAFQEFIPIMEDQARYDLVLTAAREDLDVIEGIDVITTPDIEKWRSLFNIAWTIHPDSISFPNNFRVAMRDAAHQLNDELGGGPLVVGVAVHEKLLRMTCAFAILCGSVKSGRLVIEQRHLDFAVEFLKMTLNKPSLGYGDYIREFKRAQQKRIDNMNFVRVLITAHPAIKALLSSSSFRGFQFQEILGLDKDESSKIMSDLITRGLLRPGANACYIPDKVLMEISKEMEV